MVGIKFCLSEVKVGEWRSLARKEIRSVMASTLPHSIPNNGQKIELRFLTTRRYSVQGKAKRWSPGCVNAADQARQKFTKPGVHLLAKPCTSLSHLALTHSLTCEKTTGRVQTVRRTSGCSLSPNFPPYCALYSRPKPKENLF